jgi:hypothetical protein
LYGDPAQLSDVGTSKTKGSVPLALPQNFLGLLHQRFPGLMLVRPHLIQALDEFGFCIYNVETKGGSLWKP